MAEQRLSATLLELRLRRAFNLSQASAERKQTLIVRYGDGIGEGSSSIHYGLSSEENFSRLQAQLFDRSGYFSDSGLLEFVNSLPPELNVARCAIEMAFLDLQAQGRGVPLYESLDLAPPGSPASSFTVTSGSEDEIKQQMESASEFRAIKVKVGFAGDLKLIEEILKIREVRLRLDANGGWTREETIERIKSLRGYPIDFVEQPLATLEVRDLDYIKTKCECVIVLDESIKTGKDIEHFAKVADGVNLKLSKCGGVSRVVAMAKQAREQGMKLLLGCMVESAVGITAALHLASLFDYLDLDAILLTEDDPYWGALFTGDNLLLPAGPGIGVTTRENVLA